MMRTHLKSLACAGFALLMVGSGAQADNRSITEKWAEVEANAAIFRKAAERLNFTSSWDEPTPIRLTFLPPATEADVLAVERQMGETLPPTLRAFFLEASAGVDVFWLVPGQSVVTDGVTNIDYHLLPPPPWQEVWRGYGGEADQTVPKINGGVLDFSLKGMVGMRSRAKPWSDGFRESAKLGSDEGEIAHYTRYAEFWERGLPIAFDGGGNVVAVDQGDWDERLIFGFHDGSDEPGWFLEMNLIDFMVTQSRLGFPGLGQSEFISFADPEIPEGAMASFYREEHFTESERLGLALPSSVVMSVDAPGVDIWRAWLGL